MRALVVGGSSGIGLSIVLELCADIDYEQIYVIDKSDFPLSYSNPKINFLKCDLSNLDLDFENIPDAIDSLYITAGFGKLSFFQDLSEEYIQTIFQVNTISVIRIIHRYYKRLLSDKPFYCAIMVSIAARLSSPLFSVYSATKAALSKFIEAVNIELEEQGSNNRILEVSPGSIQGTGFNGGVSTPELTTKLAKDIIKKSKDKEVLFIPGFEETFKDVIAQYENNPHDFGINSFNYKIDRLNRCTKN